MDVFLGSGGDQKPHVGCSDRFKDEVQELDLVVDIVALVKAIDDNGDWSLE